MEYNHIKNYLEKFKTILFSKEENIKIVSMVIEKNTSIKIETKNILIKGPYIYIKSSPIIRNEVMIKKNDITKDLSLVLKGTNILDIK